jgi:pilus assembly protein CpaB
MAANPNRLRIFLVAAILAALGVLGISKYKDVWHWNSVDPADVAPVIVADRYIPAFAVIKPEMVRAQEFPKRVVPPGSLKATSELTNESGQLLFTSAIAIPEGHPVTRALVTDASQNDTLGSLIRPGKVAVSFEIDRSHGVGGWIRPGDTVAVFGPTPMTAASFKTQGKKMRLLFPSVLVVAVDDKRLGQSQTKAESATDSSVMPDSGPPNGAKIITVLVSPTEASAIIEAREEGNLSVVLRSLGDEIPWPQVD